MTTFDVCKNRKKKIFIQKKKNSTTAKYILSFQFLTIYLFPLTLFPINKPKYESIPMHDYIHHSIKEIKMKLFNIWYSNHPIELKVRISLFGYHCIHIISFIIDILFHSMIQETKKKKKNPSLSSNVIYHICHIKKLPIRIIKSWPSFQLISKFSPNTLFIILHQTWR